MQFNFLHQQPVFSLNDDSLSLFPIGWIAQHPANLLLGLPFSLTLMFILFACSYGLAALCWLGVDVTKPLVPRTQEP